MTEEIDEKFTFQILDWIEHQHQEDEGGDDDDSENGEVSMKKYLIQLFGKTKDQKSVYLEVTDFKPYFYIEVPKNWSFTAINRFMEAVKENVWPKQNKEGLIKFERVEKCRFYGFTNYSKFTFLQLQFENIDSMRSYDRALKKYYKIITISKYPIKIKIYESNLLPMLRLMHIKNMNAVGTISIPKKHLNKYTYLSTNNDYNYKVNWKHIEAVEEQYIEKFSICAFDIECTSTDGSFPQADRLGDKIIQIGLTLSRYGDSDCYEKYLLSLGETDNIDGAVVQWFETETDLLLGFTKLMRKINPDIITGYNIFGFDWKYIKGRVDRLTAHLKEQGKTSEANKFINNVEKLSRINNEISKFEEKNLSSSALGENILTFYKMTGRVQIDLMKVIQKDFKLSSYKLDYVAANFIRDGILSLDIDAKNKTIKIETKSTFGLTTDNYITLGFSDGAVEDKYEDGRKFKVQQLDKNSIIIHGKMEDLDEFMIFDKEKQKMVPKKGISVFWTQAKDDITPRDIFEMAGDNGTPQGRATIGRYCLQDSALCNRLINKLQIITNNVGMANVCNVPLSFLFFRGQGIKIFSLVAKKCREKNHLLPVLKKEKRKDDKDKDKDKNKNKDNKPKPGYSDIKTEDQIEKELQFIHKKNMEIQEDEEEEDDGYEGAIVFIPKPGVYFEPIPVLDYSSLYPSSMILRNLSHECFVDDPAYDNLPGYKYHEITYLNNDETTTTCRFAEKKDGTKGIIPEILTDLLTARKKYKKLMENEKDYFKKGVLDGLQQAYKVTANSLYGQTGAGTSDVRMKEIAASTTATGREMLQFAKYFIENMYSKVVVSALEDKERFVKEMYELYKYYPTKFDTYHPTKTSKDYPDGIPVTIHVNTGDNEEIPASKFNVPEVGYEVNYKFEDGEWETIIKKMINILPSERESFFDHMDKYCCGKKKSKHVYKEFETLLKEASINDIEQFDGILTKIEKLNDENKNNFLMNLRIAIDDVGFKNKEHFIEKVYVTMNKLLKGYMIDAKIIYGDSVTGDTPLLLRDKNGNILIKSIEELGNEWAPYYNGILDQNKLEDKNIDYETWTEKGWTKINRVIKHKTNKKIYGVLTHSGYVQVTEDHSLLNKDGERIKPSECREGTELLHSFPTQLNMRNSCSPSHAYNDSFLTDDPHILCKTQSEALRVYIMYRTKGFDVSIRKEHSGMFSIVLKKNNDGTFVQHNNDINNTKITQISEIQYKGEQWVYDLETENHHFHAGIGEMIVHNTDSVFFCPHIKDLKTGELQKDKKSQEIAIRLGIWASTMVGCMMPPPMKLEYEKVLWPFIIQGKKRYVGNLYEKDPNKFKQKSMGIELKRRDNAPIVKTVSAGIIHKIVNQRDPVGAYNFVKDMLEKIINGKFKMNKFVITKTLKGNALTKEERILEAKKSKEHRSYADRTRIVHAVLADRIADRDPGNKPLSNDRIPYVYIETDREPELQGDRVETPEYIIENNLKIDFLFYITNQIMKPSLKFLDLIANNADGLFNQYIIREENRKRNTLPLSYYSKNKNKKCDTESDSDSESESNNDSNTKKKYKNNSDSNSDSSSDSDSYDPDKIQFNKKNKASEKTKNKKQPPPKKIKKENKTQLKSINNEDLDVWF